MEQYGNSRLGETRSRSLAPARRRLASLLAGVILMGWIVGKASKLRQPAGPHWTELLYFALGLAMAALGLMVSRA